MSQRLTLAPHIHRWMGVVAERRPVFHSEADFQFALSQVMSDDGAERIRLERRVLSDDYPAMRLDVTAFVESNPVVLELKYPRDSYAGTVLTEGHNEDFMLPAGDPGLVYIWKDVERVEQLVGSGAFAAGASVTLTNFQLWCEPPRRNQLDDFLLFEGRTVDAGSTLKVAEGTTWAPAGITTSLTFAYTCSWRHYSAPGNAEFRYLVLEPGA